MNKHNIKRILICLVLLACIIGAASASDVSDIELDDSTIDAVAVDAISEDSGDTVYNTVSEVQANASQELNDDNVVEQTKNSLSSSNIKDGEVSNTLYVSTTGSDDNDGSASAPVATIAKALEIATNSSGTDFTISIAAGEYASETIDSPEGKNINLLGADRDTTILRLSGTYGINLYNEGISWNIENLTICDINSTAGRSVAVAFFGDNSNITINNCLIKNITSKYGAFTAQSAGGTANIKNTIIEDIHASTSSASVMYFSGAGSTVNIDNIEIHGFDLSESYEAPATYARAIFYEYGSNDVVTLTNSRVTGNSFASYAGIIESKSKFTIVNTTFADNYIKTSLNGNNGGNYLFWSGTSSSSNSQMSFSQCTIVNNTIAKSGTGLFNLVYGTHNIDHSIIMNNVYANGDDAAFGNVTGSASITADNNYWGTNERPNTRTSQWVILTAETPEFAFVNVPDAITFYLNSYNTTSGTVGVLDKTLGEVTLDVTYALNTGNPSTVTIKDSMGTVDYLATQDGTETVTLSTGDAFSFEINADASSLIYVDGSVETSGTGTSESPFKTIAEALNIAADGKIIMIRSGTYNEKDLVIDDDITVRAERGANVYIDAESQGRIFTVTSTATLRDLVLSNGTTDANGGAIYLNGGILTLNNVYIYDSKALNGGAVADTADSNLIVIDSNFVGNNATNGGAIYVAGTANITDSAFLANDPDNGGAIYVTGTANIESNQFTSNVANNGGAIYIDSANPQTIKDNTFASNVADHNEAIYIKNAAVDLSGNTLGENEVIYLESGSIKSKLTFLGGNTITADFSETLDVTATLSDDKGNTIRGGSVTFTANGETIGTIDLSGDNELKTSYTTPASADSDVTISGSYSLDNAGTVVDGTVHLAIPKWFIEDGDGYETLAEAVAASKDGDVIYGLPGTYVVNGISTSKDITIKANETGTIILDADKSKMFTFTTLADVNLVNLTFINGPSVQGGFVSSSSSGAVNIVNCTFKDTSSTADGAAISASYTKLNIDSCVFENVSAKSGVIAFTGNSGNLNISNSVFNNLTGSYDGFIITTKAPTSIVNSNFTNLIGPTGSYYYGAIYATGAMNITGSKFVNITGPKGAVIYSTGALNVTKSVFDTITTDYSVIYASSSSTNVNYNIFVNNNKGIDSSYVKADYNFWGTNDKPSSSIISSSRYTYWTIVELSSAADTVYMGTTADIAVQFVGTDGSENLTLDEAMPEYSFDLAASSGTIDPVTVTLEDNDAYAEFTPASQGTVTITATPGPSELVLNVMDPSVLLVVSSEGDDIDGTGTFDNPYETIEHALTQVTDTRNIVYILNKGDDYVESDLTVSGNVIIRGEDSTVTIDADNDGRVFIVTGTLTLEDISLTGAMTNDIGGAIFVNGGNLTANNVYIYDCGAGSGGAIGSTAGSNLTVNNSAFDGNIATYGGAIYVAGEASISDSEFYNHEFSTYGGAIYVNTTNDVSISSNVFADNDADKGETIYIENGAVNLSENTMNATDTIYLKGGSVNAVLIFLANSTVTVDFGETASLTASLTDDQGNAIRGGAITFTADGETVATVDLSGDNELETSFTVPSDASGDILISGSYSLDDGGIVATGVLHPAISYWFIEGGNGYETLAEAIAAASSGDVIYGLPGTYTVNGLALNKDITLKANESGDIILDGNGNRVFSTNGNVKLINLTFTNGATTGDGGLVLVSGGTLTVNNTVFKDTIMSTSSTHGAAISGAGNINVYDSVFENLSARQGAAIWQTSSSYLINIVGSVFNNINSSYDGGLISSSNSVSISKSNFTNIIGANTKGEYGNVRVSGGNLTITESNFKNISGPGGAVVYMTSYSGNLNITKSVFENINCTNKGIIYTTSTSYINYNVFLDVNEGVNSTSSGASGVNLDYNYWGTNENPSTAINTISPSKWVVMTVSPETVDTLDVGASQAFTVDFTHCTDGTANYTMEDTIPELTVSASAEKGTLDKAEAETASNQAVFTYTAPLSDVDTITFTNTNANVPITVNINGPYAGIIYVAKNGSNENDGRENAPVATIAKAVELAQAGSGQIIINEGTYNENNITINSAIPISIKGEGNVVIDGTDLPALSIFTIKSADVSIENISFRNNAAKFGAAINVQGASGSSLLDANILINDCSFDNLGSNASGSQGGAIYAKYLKGSLVINNSNFTNSIVKSWGGAITVGYSAYEDALDLVISNSNFENNSGNNGGAAYLMANTISIVNTSFINNNATYSPGALELYNCTATMDNCSFINNIAGNVAAAIKLEFVNNQPISSLKVTNSIFKDNVGRDAIVPAIFVDRASLNISNSILLNPLDVNTSTVTGYNAVYGQGVTIANNNWWGTNENPFNLTAGTGDHVNTTIDNWVIMNVDPTETTGFTGEAVEINVDFKHTNSTDGTIADLEGGLPEELTVNAYVTNGTLDKTVATTEDLEAKFAFTPEFAGANVVVIYTDLTNTVPVVINVAEEYSGIIYVAKDGEDTNDGSEESPVASIAKAVELAQGKSGQIIIKEGTYTENGIVITDDLNISTVGEVILNGNGLRYFDIKSGDISIANVTMTNCNNTYGGAVIRVTGGSLTIADSFIVANGGEYRDNLIRVTTASLTLNNTVFENNTAHKTSTNYGGVYVSDGVLIVDGCTFKDNFNKYGQLYVTGSSIGSYAVINNTQFIGNNATSASGGTGAAIYLGGTAAYQYTNGTVRPGAPSTVYVVDCDFINNSAKGGTYYAGQGGAIYVNNNASLYVSDSRFINNTCIDNTNGTIPSQGGAIFASAGNIFITGSVFENNIAKEGSEIYMKYYGKDNTTLNALNITNSIIKDDGESVIVSNYTNGTLLANNNWWGANTGAEGKVTEGITVDNWVIMNVDPVLVENGHVGEAIEINVDFKHTNSTDGTIADLEGGLPEELTVNAYVTNGTLDKTTATTEDLAAKFVFTPEFTGANVVVIYTDLTNTVPVVINVAEPVQGVIYVAKDGSDENDGSEDSPVATIAKAVELAKAGSGQIIIKEGTYNENGITIDSAMSIEGQGEVIIDGTDLANASAFTVATNESVSFKNIKFANNAAPNGGAIFAERQEVDITVDNCEFDNLKATSRDGGAIGGMYLTGSIKVLNSKFTNNNARAWGGAIGIGYSAYEDALSLEIENCIFENNTANNGGAMYLMARNISIKDSIVNNNSATYSPGAIYMINTTAVIDNCTITNNSARDEVSAIEIHSGNIQMNPTLVNPSNVVIKNSVIEDNYGREGTAPAIQMQNSNMNASYCSIVNEFNLENTVTATYGDEKPGLVQLENIWWGTDDPESKLNGTNYTVDKWVIMNLNPSATNVSAGDVVTVTVDFNHVMTADGQIEELTGGVIPKTYTVTLSAENGTLSAETLEIAQGDSAEFTFTAAGEFALITATSENDVVNITFTGDIPEPFTGIVYVSKDGDDANEGSEDEPVATIAKAIEIATAEGGSGQIVIKEGTYTENGFNITKDLTITGEGDVIIDALGDGTRLFNIGYGSGVANFELHNLALTNLASLYGAAVYSYANNMVLDNVTIANIDSQTSRLITSNGALTVKDSVFANNTVSGLISHGGNANINIINTTIENNNVTYDSSIFGAVYVSSGRGNITIEDSKFYGNLARQSTIRGTADTNIVVKGSEFINNTADNGMYTSSGGVIYAQAKLDVTESIFINNAAKNYGGAISVGRNGEATITKSEFINNSVSTSDSAYNGAAIYNNGQTTINYSIILSNSTKYAVYNDGEESATVNAQYNWWGTNDNPQSLAGAGTWEDYWEDEDDCQAVDVSNWIVMSVTAEGIDAASEGSEVTLTVDFNHYIDANGEVKELEDSLAQELEVEFSSTAGTFDNEIVTTTDGVATAKYTVASGENDITVKSTNAVWNTEFATKAVPDISFEIVEDTIEVSLSYEGEGLEGKTVKVNLENGTEFVATTDEDGNAVIDLSSLGPGTYEFTLSSVADEDYGAAVYEETITYTVDPYLTELAVDDVTVIVGEGNLTAILTSNGVGVAGKTLVLDINTKLPEKAVGAIATMTAVTDEDGIAVFDLSGLEAGIYEATVSYTDGVVYESVDADVIIEVDKKVADTTVEIDDDNNLIVTVKDGEDGLEGIEVELTINNQTLKGTTDADGKAVIALGEMEDGSYPATISFTNDTYADPNLKTFVILKTKEVEVPVEVPVVANGTMDVETEDGAVVATLTDSEGNPIANATISAVVDGEEQNFTTDENGKVSVPIADNATVELSYTDPENGATVKYATKVVTNVVEVPVEVPEPKANATVELTTEDGSSVTVTVKDLDGNPIANASAVASINGEETNITTDSEGKATIPLSGNSTVKVSFTDPANNATTSNEMSITVINNITEKIIEVIPNRTETVIEYSDMNTTSVVVGVDGRIGEFFNATLKDINGNPLVNKTVQIGFNGKTYNRTTDENGHVELQINLKVAGRYTFALAYLGDEYYNGTFEVALITVEAQKAKLTTASKTYKASAKTKSISATFKSASGNAIPGIKVSFTVNGKTYTAKTNSKGVVTVKVSLNKKGTYNFTAKTTATDAYASVSAKAKLTIK